MGKTLLAGMFLCFILTTGAGVSAQTSNGEVSGSESSADSWRDGDVDEHGNGRDGDSGNQ